jgi:ATP-dependent RNA helicase HelY
MFDAASERLIRDAPQLQGIDTARLPQTLTQDFAEIALLGLRFGDDQETSLTLDARTKRLRELAAVYEALVDRGTDGETQRAAAFVAGTAYRLLSDVVTLPEQKEAHLFLSKGSIDSRVAAPLLFLIAEQYPDAREVRRGLSGKIEGGYVRVALLESIRDLAEENLEEIISRANRLSASNISADDPIEEQAATALYGVLWTGIILMSAEVLGQEAPRTRFGPFANAEEAFDKVLSLAVGEIDSPEDGIHFLSTYSGPRHMARLLKHLCRKWTESAIITLQSPPGTEETIWLNWLLHRAKTKPILWHNHRSALNTEFHFPGNSAVLVFPTGAGKTTLSEIKIASTLAAGKSVVFLVPTLALVDQLTRDLEDAFPEDVVKATRTIDGDIASLFLSEENPTIQVMTPERCLALQSFASERFANVGLVILDECHILSDRSGRRGIDAMFCILQTFRLSPEADLLLLSAMIRNGNELASWIAGETNRPCHYIEDYWKPSRQARGVVVYENEEYRRSLNIARNIKNSGPRKGAEAARSMRVTPYALFGLSNLWANAAQADTSLIKLLNKKVLLVPKYSPGLYATPNSNEVAKTIAVAAARSRMKTIVFVQKKDWTVSTSNEISAELFDGEGIELPRNQQEIYDAIKEELGGTEYSFIRPPFLAVPHNADLIALERRLAETLFKWPNGANVIVATPTLSQGMNLPAELVVIASDKRHDEESGRPKDLEAHEILNAAGRAGRAGHLANGLVVMIPGDVLTFADENNLSTSITNRLGALLPENDRCVDIADPLATTLDRLQVGGIIEESVKYTIRRAALGATTGEEHNFAATLVKRSLAAFRARQHSHDAIFEQKIQLFVNAVANEAGSDNAGILEIAVKTGLPTEPLQAAQTRLRNQIGNWPTDVCGWINWFFDWMGSDQASYEALFASELKNIKATISSTQNPTHLDFVKMREAILAWVQGKNFVEIEKTLVPQGSALGSCDRTRVLATTLAPRVFAFLFGTLAGMVRQLAAEMDSEIPSTAVLECLPTAIRKGFDRPAKVAFAELMKSKILSRVQVHQAFAQKLGAIDLAESEADFRTIYSSVAGALE